MYLFAIFGKAIITDDFLKSTFSFANIYRNCDFTLPNLKLQLEEGFAKVNAQTGIKIIRKIKKDEFWNEDMNFDPNE